MTPRVRLILIATFFLAAPLRSQPLDDRFTVTVNGQTVLANADGSFTVSNVPADNGLIRVTAMGVRDGTMLYGSSEFFDLTPGQTLTIECLSLSPFPLRRLELLTAVPETRTLTAIGQTTPMLVTGRFSDQSTGSVALQSQGTAYLSSNQGVVTVDANGLVTATGPGRAIVTASNQGATATARINVSFAPPTMVEGYVRLTNGNVVPNATVTLLDLGGSAVTDSAGFFCIGCSGGSVPSDLGDLSLFVEAQVNGQPFTGFRSDLAPVPGGITDAGIIPLGQGSVFWFSPSDGLWTDGFNWANGAAPTPQQFAQIVRAGGYQVSARGAITCGGFRVAGGPSLLIETRNGSRAVLTASGNAESFGAVLLGSQVADLTTLDVTGTFFNRPGGLLSFFGAFGGRRFTGDLENDGDVIITRSTRFGGGNVLTNRGSFLNQGGGGVTVEAGGTFRQEAGTLTIDAPWVLLSGAFELQGGQMLGTERPVLSNGSLTFGPTSGNSAGRFTLRGLSTLTGDIGPLQDVSIETVNGLVALTTAPADFENRGLLALDSTIAATSELRVQNGALTNRPGGVIRAEGAFGGRRFGGQLVNEGTVDIQRSTTINAGSRITQKGLLNIGNAQGLTFEAGIDFVQESGTTTLEGSMLFLDGAFRLEGGEIVGSGVPLLRRCDLVIGGAATSAPPGPASFEIQGASTFDGTLGPDHMLRLKTINGLTAVLTSLSDFTSAGTILLDSDISATTTLDTSSGALTVLAGGSLESVGAFGSRRILGTVVNEGLFRNARGTSFSPESVLIQRGDWTIESGITVNFETSGLIRQESGTTTNDGTLVMDAGAFELNGGDIVGSGPVRLQASDLRIAPSGESGTAAFEIRGDSTLVGNVGPEHSLRLFTVNGSTAVLSTLSDTVSSGTIRLDGNITAKTILDLTSGQLTISPTGRLEGVSPFGTHDVVGDVINEGAMQLDRPTRFTGPSMLTQRGTFDVAASQTVTLTAGSLFRQESGTTTTDGTLHVIDGTFDHQGGDVLGTHRVLLQDSQLSFGPSSSPTTGAFRFRGPAATLTGDVGPAHDLFVESSLGFQSTVTAPTAFTNEGTITLGSQVATQTSLVTQNGPLTNTATGTIRTIGPFGTTRLSGDLINDGTVSLEIGTSFTAGSSVTNQASFSLATGRSAIFESGTHLIQAAGTLTTDGQLTMTGGAFTLDGGDLTGTTTPVLESTDIVFGPGSASSQAALILRGASTWSGDIGAAQEITVQVRNGLNATLSAAQGFTNAGTLRMEDLISNAQLRVEVTSGTLTNTGLIWSAPTLSGSRTLAADLVNDGELRVDRRLVLAGSSFDSSVTGSLTGTSTLSAPGVTFTSAGTIAPAGSGAPGVLTIQADPVLSASSHVEIELAGGGNGNCDVLTVNGTVTLNGALDVSLLGGFQPTLGQTFDVVGFNQRNGQFATVTGTDLPNGLKFQVSYEASSVRLTVVPQ